MLDAALDAVGLGDSTQRARLLATLAAELMFSTDRDPIELARESVEMARRTGDPQVVLDTSLVAGDLLATPEHHAEHLRITEEAMRLTDGLADTRRAHALGRRITALWMQGDMAGTRDCAQERTALADRLGQPFWRWIAALDTAAIELHTGSPTKAETLLDEALALGGAAAQPDAFQLYAILLNHLRYVQGRCAEMTPLIAELIAEDPLPTYRAALAHNLAVCGDLEAARTHFDRLAADDFAFPKIEGSYTVALVAETAALLNDRHAAERLTDRLSPYQTQIAANSADCLGAVSHYLGLLAATLGRDTQAEEFFLDAIERHERLETPFFQASTRIELARLTYAAPRTRPRPPRPRPRARRRLRHARHP